MTTLGHAETFQTGDFSKLFWILVLHSLQVALFGNYQWDDNRMILEKGHLSLL